MIRLLCGVDYGRVTVHTCPVQGVIAARPILEVDSVVTILAEVALCAVESIERVSPSPPLRVLEPAEPASVSA
jgi:hypothetical protein